MDEHKIKKADRMITALFLAVQSAVYIIYLAEDILFPAYDNMKLKYFGIILCAVYAALSVLFFRNEREKGSSIILPAILLTLISDYFLIFAENNPVGVSFFISVQLTYFIYLIVITGKKYALLRIGLMLIAWGAVLITGLSNDLTNVLSAAYFSLLISNVIHALIRHRLRFAIGLILFMCCDICVGLYNLDVISSGILYRIIGIGMWAFYLPSQVLIVTSGYFNRNIHTLNKGEFIMKENTKKVSSGPKGKSSRILTVLFSLSLSLLLISASIAVPILVRPFYYAHINAYHLCDKLSSYNLDLSRDQVKEAYNEMIDYCIDTTDHFSTGILKYSESGKSHFTDCKKLFILDFRVFWISFCVFSLCYLFMRYSKICPAKTPKNHGCLFFAGIGTGVLFAVLGVLIAINPDNAFIVFHKIFFPGKTNWYFDSAVDQIILILPEQFFINCGILIVGLILVGCILFLVFDRKVSALTEKRIQK